MLKPLVSSILTRAPLYLNKKERNLSPNYIHTHEFQIRAAARAHSCDDALSPSSLFIRRNSHHIYTHAPADFLLDCIIYTLYVCTWESGHAPNKSPPHFQRCVRYIYWVWLVFFSFCTLEGERERSFIRVDLCMDLLLSRAQKVLFVLAEVF